MFPSNRKVLRNIAKSDALSNGTLFPGLNLPFRLKVEGSTVPVGPLAELQALEFVVAELGMYLDTHPSDQEAFDLFQKYAAMEKSARETYQAKFGPLTQSASANGENYQWLKEPWPWNYAQNEVK